MCSGWGDPHYITFDGTYYTFLDNCTYVLVQQIVPVYGHFRVLIDNYFCDAEDGLSCPQSIIVEYRQDRVMMTRKPVQGVMTNEVGTPAQQLLRVRGGQRWGASGADLLPSLCLPLGCVLVSRSSSMVKWSAPASRKMASTSLRLVSRCT